VPQKGLGPLKIDTQSLLCAHSLNNHGKVRLFGVELTFELVINFAQIEHGVRYKDWVCFEHGPEQNPDSLPVVSSDGIVFGIKCGMLRQNAARHSLKIGTSLSQPRYSAVTRPGSASNEL
jgi:hypothetical protein